MKNCNRTLILLLALVMILLTISGGIVATEKTHRVVVWTYTQHWYASFTATEPEGYPWSWAIKVHQAPDHPGYIHVQDTGTGQTILSDVSYVDVGGSLTGLIHNGHTYSVTTYTGNEPVPGWATCSVSSADYEPEGPQGP